MCLNILNGRETCLYGFNLSYYSLLSEGTGHYLKTFCFINKVSSPLSVNLTAVTANVSLSMCVDFQHGLHVFELWR